MTHANPECIYCGGTGEVSTMEAVYANEPHMADVGSAPCECTIDDSYDEDDDVEELQELDENQNHGSI